jgi:Predicted periplasmic lipoprotein (DUF2279)
VKRCILIFSLLLSGFTQAQDSLGLSSKPQIISHTRKWVLGGVQVSLWGGSFFSLNKAWYANYPRSTFHFYNDWQEWQQMDKMGHAWSTYQISQHTSKIWQWAGMDKKKSVWIGSLSGLAYLSIIEILDGYSDKWGFSGYDVLANASGATLFALQALQWEEQRIQLKMSYSPVHYGDLKPRSNALFGSGDVEKVLKDYNGQTYWLSFNIKSFFPESAFPAWLNLAAGYGAKTMLGGYQNKWDDALGNSISRFDIPRYKRFHLALDLDLTKIKTRNHKIATVLSLFNVLKVPAPSIEINSLGKVQFHPLFF